MKKGVILVAVFTALMMISGVAWSYDIDRADATANSQHVKVSPGNKGDLLIFPFYFAANGGWETKLTVVNTSTTYSVVAKVIFRSHLYSEELLDFLIYLTPADVWTGMVRNNGAMTYIYSEDDSMLASSDTFASPTSPVSQQIYEPRCTTTPHNLSDSADYGYLEVIESWYGNVANVPYTGYLRTGESQNRPVTKAYLKRIYDDYVAGNANGFPGLGEAVPPGLDRTINVMAGFLQFQNPLTAGLTSGMQAVAFADWDNISPLVTANVSGLLVNPVRNSIGELEAALAKNNLAYPYVNNPESGVLTVHLFNFPTKISQWDSVSTDSNRCRYIDGRGNFWNDPSVPGTNTYTATHRVVTYGAQYFDTKENALSGGPYSGGSSGSTMPEELNILHTGGYSALFTEGWTNYNFTILNNAGAYTGFCDEFNGGRGCAAPTHSYTGIPVIGTVMEFVQDGIKLFEPAYTDGMVYTGTPAAPVTTWFDFQYYNELTELGRASF